MEKSSGEREWIELDGALSQTAPAQILSAALYL
jgi:hypothetical protein